MAEYLLDTDHLSYLQKSFPSVVQHLASHPSQDRILTSVVSIGELLLGLYSLPRGRRQQELLEFYHQLLDQMEAVLPITQKVAERYAQVGSRLRKEGRPIPSNDIWIAAVALVRGAVLVTNDVHFQYIEGLKVENWTR